MCFVAFERNGGSVLNNENWIRSETAEDSGCPLFFKCVCVGKKLRKATAEVTAVGIYNLYVNGNKVGDALFAPGWTSYHNRLQYQMYDVTELFSVGENAVAIHCAPGWAVGYIGHGNTNHMFFDHISVSAAFKLEYADGSEESFFTGDDWQVGTWDTKTSEFYHGEYRVLGAPVKITSNAVADTAPDTKLIEDEGCPVTEHERIKAVSLIITPRGERVIDFGQNLAGYVEIRIKGKAGDRVSISHAEVLDKDGNFYTKNMELAKNRNVYVLSGGEDILKPKFSFQGYRYIRLDEYPFDNVETANFTSVAVYSQMKRTGLFECGNKKINRLYLNTIWGQRSNFIDIPTDCPQRDERVGWTGDVQVFVKTAAINYDVSRFMRKWLRDVMAEQRADGAIPSVVPGVDGRGDRISTAWGDVCTVAPWELYLAYGDKSLLEEFFPMMERWIEYMHGEGEEEFLWLGGEHYGDWLASDAILCPEVREGATQTDLIASAFFAYSVSIMIKACRVLGKKTDKYEELHANIKRTFRSFFMKDGLPALYPKHDALSKTRPVKGLTQTAVSLVLRFELYEGESERELLVKTLVDMINANGGKMNVGFVGTPHILHALSENGRSDVAYNLFLCEKNPSWLYSVNCGATTVWEHWDGIRDDGSFWYDVKNSFNHYAYGSVFDWVYAYVLGIKINESGAGYGNVDISPVADRRLGFAEGSVLTKNGKVSVKWEYVGDRLRYAIELPHGVKARITLADGNTYVREGGACCFECGA